MDITTPPSIDLELPMEDEEDISEENVSDIETMALENVNENSRALGSDDLLTK